MEVKLNISVKFAFQIVFKLFFVKLLHKVYNCNQEFPFIISCTNWLTNPNAQSNTWNTNPPRKKSWIWVRWKFKWWSNRSKYFVTLWEKSFSSLVKFQRFLFLINGKWIQVKCFTSTIYHSLMNTSSKHIEYNDDMMVRIYYNRWCGCNDGENIMMAKI